jgi:hypothetical protein
MNNLTLIMNNFALSEFLTINFQHDKDMCEISLFEFKYKSHAKLHNYSSQPKRVGKSYH